VLDLFNNDPVLVLCSHNEESNNCNKTAAENQEDNKSYNRATRAAARVVRCNSVISGAVVIVGVAIVAIAIGVTVARSVTVVLDLDLSVTFVHPASVILRL